jgi:predicted permease
MRSNLGFDLKYAGRLFLKTPGYSALCVIVVALSVGLAIWSYELVYTVALKPLPFPGTDRWLSVQIAATATDSGDPSVDAYTYQELRKSNRGADYLGAFGSREAVLSEGQASTALRAALIDPQLLAAMQTAPQLGRIFEAADAQQGATRVGILSFDAWHTYFAADPAIIGKQTRIDGQPVQIIAVMPKEFYAFQDFELWLPLQLPNLTRPADSNLTLSPIVVLNQGESAASVLSQMQPIVSDINARYPQSFDPGRHAALFPAHRMQTHGMVQFAAMVSFVAIAVLLLGCVNVSLVFFARLLERSRELALRSALGSSRARLLRQCLLETVPIVLLGLLLATGLAALGIRWGQYVGEYPAQILGSGRPANLLALHGGDIAAAAIIAMSVWLLSTLIPAWSISRQDASTVLGSSGKGSSSNGRARTAGLLVGLEVLVSTLVLVICANLVLAVKAEAGKPNGLDTARTAHIMLSTSPTEFAASYAGTPDRLRYWDTLAAAVRAQVPGTEVGYSTAAPTRPSSVSVAIEHREGSDNRGALLLPVTAVSENYFGLLGIGLRGGRAFEGTDTRASQPVAIVDENVARRYWPNQDALGKRIQLNPKEGGPWLTVVGVASHVGAEPYSDDVGVIYRPLRQAVPSAFQLLVKLPSGTAGAHAALRAAAFSVDPSLPLHNLQLLGDYLQALDFSYHSLATAFSAIAAITVILAASGLFGLISRSVSRRTQEVGVRRALGGTQWQVIRVFLRQGIVYLSVGAVGVIVGILITNLLSDAISNILVSVIPVTFAVAAVMAFVIFGAAYIPAQRAVLLEPGEALRYE